MTLQQIIDQLGLTMTAKWTDRNPHMANSDQMDHWRCSIRNFNRQSMRVFFSKGYGHHGKEPDLAEVLECLAMDAAGIENAGGFEEWCSEYGYETDSRRALKTFNATSRQADSLKRVLGHLYQTALFELDEAA